MHLGKRLVLASKSPRRREIISAFLPEFDLIQPTGEEPEPEDMESPSDYVKRVSFRKAREVSDGARGAIVIGADTVVVYRGCVLGKPSDVDEARWMLNMLRGDTHLVLTGVTVVCDEPQVCRQISTSSKVTLRRYSDDERDQYILSGDVFDKAGSYAVQDECFLPASEVVGCYLNVVGFPLCEVNDMLHDISPSVSIRSEWRPPPQCKDCPLENRRYVGIHSG